MKPRGRRLRFNDEQYLTDWVDKRQYPAIHNNIFSAIENWTRGKSALDLCCSTGLLAQRMSTQGKINSVGVDADSRAIALGIERGIKVPLYLLNIQSETLNDLAKIITTSNITLLVARRCLPELFGANADLANEFEEMIWSAGIEEIVLRGGLLPNRQSTLWLL